MTQLGRKFWSFWDGVIRPKLTMQASRCKLCTGPASGFLCQECLHDLPRIEHPCPVCALPLSGPTMACGDCLVSAKPYECTVCPLLYAHPTDHLIGQFKAHQPQIVGALLSPLLLPHLNNVYLEQAWPSALVPVPLHWRRRVMRGFNQAHSLAEQLSQQTGIPCVPQVHRRQAGTSQKQLNRKRRLRNLRETFACPRAIEGEHIAVVDDVITTCATGISMAQCLLDAGAGRVDLWALARTPR